MPQGLSESQVHCTVCSYTIVRSSWSYLIPACMLSFRNRRVNICFSFPSGWEWKLNSDPFLLQMLLQKKTLLHVSLCSTCEFSLEWILRKWNDGVVGYLYVLIKTHYRDTSLLRVTIGPGMRAVCSIVARLGQDSECANCVLTCPCGPHSSLLVDKKGWCWEGFFWAP